MGEVTKRLATDESLLLLVDAVKNTESVQQAKAEIQSEGDTQVKIVQEVASNVITDINQLAKNTAAISDINSNLLYDKTSYISTIDYNKENGFSPVIVRSSDISFADGVKCHDDAMGSLVDKLNLQNENISNEIEELNSNLDALSYDENAGGKNLLDLPNPYSITGAYAKSITVKVKKNTNYTLSVGSATSSVYQGIIVRPINSDTTIIEKYTAPYIMPFNSGDNESIRIYFYSGNATSGTSVYSDVQLEYGTTATDYEPYIPSVKMLAEENAQQNTEAMDLKMLGWTVPKECPIQNYVDSNGNFHQRVGRVDLGSLEWGNSSAGFFYSSDVENMAIPITGGKRGYCSVYGSFVIVSYEEITTQDKIITYSNNSVTGRKNVCIRDTSYTDAASLKNAMKGVYLYYELEKPITMTIDGNEVTERINDSLGVKSGEIVYDSCEVNDSSLCWCKKSGHVVQCSLYLKNINTTNNWQAVVTLPFRPCSTFYIYDSSNQQDWQINTEGKLRRYTLSTDLSMLTSFTYITND